MKNFTKICTIIFIFGVISLLNNKPTIVHPVQKEPVEEQKCKPLPHNTTTTTSRLKSTQWDTLMNAIIYVESRGQADAISKDGKYVGAMQIGKIVVDDCNQYLAYKGIDKQFTYEDRFDVNKSKEMFILIQKRYNKSNNLEAAIRIWNGGCNYNIKSTQGYYNRVLAKYNKLINKRG